MMYPNPNFIKHFPEAELPEEKDRSKRSSCLRIGAYAVIKKIIEEYGLDEMMNRIIGKDSGLLLNLAAYSIITEILQVSTILIMAIIIRFLQIA